MGAVFQTAGAAELVAELTCCACSSVCGLVTSDGATRAKFRYCSFLLLATVTCVILLIPGLRLKLDKIPHLCNKIVTPDICDRFVGFGAVYRILFAITVFHFILSILTIRVTRAKSFRAKFNNGLWFFKMGLIFGLTTAAFFIPKKTAFFRIWMYISLTGGFMFVMFQIILIIDFGHSWSLSWAEKLDTGYTKLWYLAMAVVTLLMFSMSIGAIISFVIFFTDPSNLMKCHANVFYIAFISIQCFLATVVSITPSVQQELAGAGLLQSSVVVLYTMYLTWNTLSSEPNTECNPLGNIILEYDSLTGVSGEAIFGSMLTLVLLIFACTVRANTSHLGKYGLALAESEDFAMATYQEDQAKESVEKELESGEKEVSLHEYVGYNYSFFHIVMALASLHILMILTNWHSPEENSNMKKLVKNWASVWVQMASSFVCILIYVWFLVTPLIKKVWGPLFGIILEGENKINQNSPSDKHFYNKIPKSPVAELDSSKTPVNIESVIETGGKEASRPVSRHTFHPRKVNPSLSRLKKAGSDESIISINSMCSQNTAISRQSKRRSRLLIVDNDKQGETSTGIPDKIIVPSISHKEKIRKNRHRKMKEKERIQEDLYSSTESLASRVSKYVKTSVKNLKRTESLRLLKRTESLKSKKPAIIKNILLKNANENGTMDEKINIVENQEDEKKQITECLVETEEESATNKEKYIVEEELIIETKVEQKNNIAKEPTKDNTSKEPKTKNNTLKSPNNIILDCDTSLLSVVPSVFTRKAQDPNIAKEILQLQWKILRTQAKVVKIQERIIRLQAEAAMVAVEAEIPPCGASSVVEHKNIETNLLDKEHG